MTQSQSNESRYDFSKKDCQDWRKEPKKNPKTNRSIDPTAEFGVYEMLKKQCESTPKKGKMEKNGSASPRKSPSSQKNVSCGSKRNNVKSPEGIIVVFSVTVQNQASSAMQKFVNCINEYCYQEQDKIDDDMFKIIRNTEEEFQNVQSIHDIDKRIDNIYSFSKNFDFDNFFRCAAKNCSSEFIEYFSIILEKLQQFKKVLETYAKDHKIDQKIQIKVRTQLDTLEKKIKNIIKAFKSKKINKEANGISIFLTPMLLTKLSMMYMRFITAKH